MFPILVQTIQRDSSISFPGLGNLFLDPPSYFTVFGRNIYFYGVLIAIGFISALLFCSHVSSRFGIKGDDFTDMMLWLIPLSILGARCYYVLFRLDEYLQQPSKIIAVWEGGLAIYGGIIAGVLTALVFCRRRKIPPTAMLDLAIMGLMPGQILGRWGNFLNREAFGAETEIFCRMGLTAPDGTTIFVHPTFLYESLWNLIGFLVLLILLYRGLRRYDGQFTLLYYFWYGLGRSWIEGLRTDSLYIPGTGIRVSQALSLALVVITLVLLLIQSRRPHPPEALYVNRAAAAPHAEDGQDETTTN
ncbi:MAG: prolipoprotein diacylglyceryl transferase [Oscillospiraceae bacterium]|nr:prolipoprotein diacylglyceryl transferase [Oscillospiraceae bacterium]